jgi:hypothetical protein
MRWSRLLIVALMFIFTSTTPVAAAGPTLTVSAPKEDAAIMGSDVVITFTAMDFKIVPTTVPVSEAGKHPEANKLGEGHVHFVLDLQPLVVWEHTDPYTFTNVPSGEHQLMVELVNNDHSSLSPRVMRMIRFRSGSATTLPRTGMAPHGEFGSILLVLGVLMVIIGGLLLWYRYRQADNSVTFQL